MAETSFEYMRALRDCRDLSPIAKLLAFTYATHGTVHVWIKDLEGETGLSSRSITRAKKELMEKGWFERTYSGRGADSRARDEFTLQSATQAD